MRITREEREHPAEWMRRTLADEEQLLLLLFESGGLAQAAYRVARAQLLVSQLPGRPFTLAELKLAARTIALRTRRDPDLGIALAPSEERMPRELPSAKLPPLPPSRRAVG